MISREFVLELLRQKQDSSGGYTGDDIIKIATILEVTPRGLRRRLNNWINTDDDIQEERKTRDQEPLAKTTFYRCINQKILSIYCSDTYNWFKAKKIPFP